MRTRKSKRGGYTTNENAIILDCIANSPGNLKYAFEMAENQLKGRNASAISAHYYSVLKRESRALSIVTKKGVMSNNTKIMKMPKKASLAMEVAKESLTLLSRDEKLILARILMKED